MVEAAVTADNTCDTKPLRVGLDIGSTTVKAVVLDQTDSLDAVLFLSLIHISEPTRH